MGVALGGWVGLPLLFLKSPGLWRPCLRYFLTLPFLSEPWRPAPSRLILHPCWFTLA